MKRLNKLIKGVGISLLFGMLLLPGKVDAADYTIEKTEVIDDINDRVEYTLNQQEYNTWEEAAENLGNIGRELGLKREHKGIIVNIPVELKTDKKIPEIEDSYSQAFKEEVEKSVFREETGNPDAGHILRGDVRWGNGFKFQYRDGKYIATSQIMFDYRTPLDIYKTFQKETTEVLNSLNLEGKTDYEKCILIEEWVGKHITYTENNGNPNGYSSAIWGFNSRKGVCMHYVDLFYYMANKAGLCVLEDSGTSGYDPHAWNLVKMDGVYYYTDPTNLRRFFNDGKTEIEFLYGADDFSFEHSFKSDNKYKEKYTIASEMYSKDHSLCDGKHELEEKNVQAGCYPGTVYKCKNCFYKHCEYTGEENHEYNNGKITQKADCTHDEITTYSCKHCRNVDYNRVTNPALGHDIQKEEVLPTCKEDGYYKCKCSRCGIESTEPSGKEKLGHDMKETFREDPTCTSEGRVDYKCSRCSYREMTSIKSLGHDFKETETIPASCMSGTKHVFTCSRCNEKYSNEDNDKLSEHKYVEKKITKYPTCTSAGIKLLECSVCGTQKRATIPKTGHQHTLALNKTEATCTEMGYTGDIICEDCNECIEDGREIPALEHDYDEGNIIEQPTYQKDGLKEYTCKRCYDKKQEVIPKLNHTHDNYKEEIVKNPTCTRPGTKRYQCRECEYFYEEEIPATGHRNLEFRNNKNATCVGDGYTGDTYCKDCDTLISKGKVIPKLGHSYDKGTIIKEPTYLEEGKKKFQCTRCGNSYEAAIPVLKPEPAKKMYLRITNEYEDKVIFGWDTEEGYLYKNTIIEVRKDGGFVEVDNDAWSTFCPEKQPRETFYRARGHYERKLPNGTVEDVYTNWVEFSLFEDPIKEPIKPTVKVNKITVSGDSTTIASGKKIQLKATVSPKNAKNKAVTWKSSNTKYATVSSKGLVTIKKAGARKTVTITVTAKDGSGKKAIYKIKIAKGVVTRVKVYGAKPVKAGKALRLRTSVSGTREAYKGIKWVCSNTKYTSISSKGILTTKRAGKGKNVYVTAIAKDGSGKKMTVKIKIK